MKENLVARNCISTCTKEDKQSVVPPKLVYIEVRHLVIQGCHDSEKAKCCEQDSVLTSFSMLYPELLTVSETLRILLNKGCSFEANVQA